MLLAAIPLSPKVDARNLAVVELVARAAVQTVVAYGDKGGQGQRDERILDILNKAKVKPNALGVTVRGFPRHPLYRYRPDATKPTASRRLSEGHRPSEASWLECGPQAGRDDMATGGAEGACEAAEERTVAFVVIDVESGDYEVDASDAATDDPQTSCRDIRRARRISRRIQVPRW